MASRKPGNPIPSAVRVAVDARDLRSCVRCGSRSRALHHRQRRREGGHGLENVISMCNACHRFVHAHPTEAREGGYIVSVYTDDVEQVPINGFYGWALLRADGSITWASPPPTPHSAAAPVTS